MSGYVYIMASRKNGTLYTGVTADLARRAYEHRDKLSGGFTTRYDVKRLIWYREYSDITEAIADEKRIKRWQRRWKIELIEKMNPEWEDLYPTLL